MKRIFSLLVCLSILCVLTVPAFADDEMDSASDSGSSPVDTSEPSTPAESPSPASAVDTSEPVSNLGSPSVDTVPEVPETPAAPVEDVDFTTSVDSVDEAVPIQYLEADGAVQTDSSSASAFSAVSVYDFVPVPSGSDTPVSSKVSYSLTSINCPAEHIEWWFQDGYFTVVLTDAWFNEWFPGVDKAEALLNLAAYSYSLTANGSPLESYLVDFDCASLTFPYVDDGLYVFSSDSGFYLDMQITSTTVSGSLSGSSLISAVTALFGEYTPKTYNVTTYLSDGTVVQSSEVIPGLAGLDYEWLASVALFTLVLYCILRMIGGALKWS